MASGSLNGNGSAAAADGLTAAEALQRKHENEEAHNPTVEEVVDEEDRAHPPPSSEQAPAVLSEKAAGKQKMQETPEPGPVLSPRKKTSAPLDVQSHDAFPTLGATSKPQSVSRPVASAWGGANAPSAASLRNDNRANGRPGVNGAASSTTSSPQVSTPITPTSTSSLASPALPTPPSTAQRLASPHTVSIPGKHTERISLTADEIRPRKDLKKPIQEILREINRRSRATVQMTGGAGGGYHFDAQGPVEAVRQALKEVAKELGSKQSTKVAVPASIRPHIIGKQGSTVQGISQRTGARIQVPRVDEGAAAGDVADDEMIEVLIEGDSVAAEMARREIENIVNERTSSVNLRLRDIPAEFFPFLAGPRHARIAQLENGRDLKVQIPHHFTWSSQPPAVPAAGQLPTFAPSVNGPHIHVSGDRLAVQEARAELERQVQALRRDITLSPIDINKGQHRFILGDKGAALHDLLEATGCTVLVPPEVDQSETLTVIGPPGRIEEGLDRVMDLATSNQMTLVDVSRQHPKAPLGAHEHARHLTRYLQESREIERLEKQYNAYISLPAPAIDGSTSWEIYSRDPKNNIRARTEIVNIVNGLPPSRLTSLDVEPFFQRHLHRHGASRLQKDYGVRLVMPKPDHPTPTPLLLVYEGPSASQSEFQQPRQAPSAQQAAEFEKALEQAREHLLSLIVGQQDIVARSVSAPEKFHDKVRRFIDKEQQSLPQGQIPILAQVGEPTPKAGQPIRSQNPIAAAALANEVSLQGPSDRVDDLAARIEQFVVEETAYEKERGYTTSFDFPQKFANHLIGRKGENIRKYREEYDVEIQVNDGKVEIKGPKVKAEAAKSSILTLGKKLQDEATHVLKIKPTYHKDLIGAKGTQVNRLQDRYGVRINFPRSAAALAVNDDASSADAASENGAGKPNGRPAQASDEVIIRGPRKGADDARDELLSLLQYTVDNSNVATVSVAASQIPSIIGQNGREVDHIRMTTGAQIDVPDAKRDGSEANTRVDLKIKGTKKQVEDARKLLQERSKAFDDRITRTLTVDKKHHKSLIGSGGANIRDIVVKAGGPDDRRELARMVRFPRPETEESEIRVEGSKSVVDKIVSSIETLVAERENQVVEKLEIEPSLHRLLIGRSGETRRGLESQFHITLDIPKQAAAGTTPNRNVTLSGQPDNVDNAKTHILNLVRDQQGETVGVPRRLHHTISDNGRFFRRLRNDHSVTVDHGGQRAPPRPTSANTTARERINGSGAVPLITDDPDAAEENFSWEVVDNSAASGAEEDAGEIPWILKGSAENVAKARSLLETALKQATQPSTTGYLILPDPRSYRHIIGAGGAQVNSIRKQTGCKITVPRDAAREEAVEVHGSTEGVEKAKELILEAVRNGRRD